LDRLRLPPDTRPRYFPQGAFVSSPGQYDLLARWFAWCLRVTSEPTLYEAPPNGRTYRVLKIPTEGKQFAIARITIGPSISQIVAKLATALTSDNPGMKLSETTTDLGAIDMSHFLALVDRVNLSAMPSLESWAQRRGHFDGTICVVELAGSGEYHAVVRRLAPGDFAELCDFTTLTLAHVDPN
jgi:hypothetical protein